MTFDLAMSGEKKEKVAGREEDKELDWFIKSSGRAYVHRISREWKECSELRKSNIVVHSWWKLEFKVY